MGDQHTSSDMHPVCEWMLKHSMGEYDSKFLSDLFELLNREGYTGTGSGDTSAMFHDPACRELPMEIPPVARSKMQDIAISRLFAPNTSMNDRTVALAILGYIRSPASASACLLALQISKPTDRLIIHQSAVALNQIRGAKPDIFHATRLADLQQEVDRLDLSWNLEFDCIDLDGII